MSLGPAVRRLFLSSWQASSSTPSSSSGRFFGKLLPVTTSGSGNNGGGGGGSGFHTRRLSFDGAFTSKPEVERASSISGASRLISSYILSSQPTRQYHVGASTNLLMSPRLGGLHHPILCGQVPQQEILSPTTPLLNIITRSVTKVSLRKGRRKTVTAVKSRFYRLDWGGWISAKPGRARHLWKKKISAKNRLRHHVLRGASDVTILDRMVTKYWIKKKYFVNDPYENYHTRDNFHITKGIKGVDSTRLKRIKRYDADRKPY